MTKSHTYSSKEFRWTHVAGRPVGVPTDELVEHMRSEQYVPQFTIVSHRTGVTKTFALSTLSGDYNHVYAECGQTAGEGVEILVQY